MTRILCLGLFAALAACTSPEELVDVAVGEKVSEEPVTDSSFDPLPENWRPETAVQLDCAWLSQQPAEDAATTLNCGPTSLVMAAACIDGYVPEYSEVIELITWMDENIDSYRGVGENYEGYITNTVQLTEAAQGFYNLPSQYFGHESLTLSAMYEDLESGIPILTAVKSQTGNTTDVMDDGGGHFMLLVGMTPTHMVFHDPGPWNANLGEFRQYTIESFQDSWQDAGVRFLTE